MLVVAGNNITAIYLCAYFEKKRIDYRWLYTECITDYTFYLNDVLSGMEKRAFDKLGINLETAGSSRIELFSDCGSNILSGEFDSFMNELESLTTDQEGFKKIRTDICGIGREWIGTVENDFAVKMTMNSIMARNFMKGFRDYLIQTTKDEMIIQTLLSLVPREDISLNTAAGYIYSQLLDGSGHDSRLKDHVGRLLDMCDKAKQIKIDSFADVNLDREKKTIRINNTSYEYGSFIKLYDDSDASIKLVTCYLDKTILHVGFGNYKDMREKGIQQIILWNDGERGRADIYYDSFISDEEAVAYLAERSNLGTVTETISYTRLKKQYGSGNFAGWAFNVKENSKNPLTIRNLEFMDLSIWGNGHFTCALAAIANLEKRGKYMSNIAITGWGIISEMGNDEEHILKSWDNGSKIKGGYLEFGHNLKPARIRRMGRLAKMAAAVSEKCLAMSGAEAGDNTGIIMNTDYGSINLNIDFGKLLKTPDLSSPMDFANTVSNAALGHVALYFGLKGVSTLLMGSNGLSYTLRQIEKKPEQKVILCGADEYCEPIDAYAKKKYGKPVVAEGVAAVILENTKDSEWGYIIADAKEGIGFSPLYQDVKDVKEKYKKLIQKALKNAGLNPEDIDLILMSGDSGSGIRSYEEAAVMEVMGQNTERRFIKDQLGESFGAAAISSVVVGSVLVKNNRYKKVLVLGTEMSGTIEAYVVSKESR